MSTHRPPATLQHAQEALTRHAWSEAFDLFSLADSQAPLSPDALEGLASAAFWAGYLDSCLRAWERAYAGHLEQGDQRRAAGAALEVARRHAQRVNPALARGWRETAARLIAGYPDCPEHGRLLNQEANALILAGQLDEAVSRAEHARAIGLRCGDRTVEVLGLNLLGQALVRKGEVDRGLALVDESLALTGTGLLDPYETGTIYCVTIGLLRDLADFERARELTEATTAWCDQNAITSFPGVCRIHRSELLRLRGELVRAEAEARSAARELEPRTLFWTSRAFNEIGVILLREGDLDGAEEAFGKATALGMDTALGRAQVQMARGRNDLARSGLAAAMQRRAADLLDRATLLSAYVEATVAGGELEDAGRAADELESIAGSVGRAAFRAAAARARGLVLLGEGDARLALEHLRTALQQWLGLNAVYEAAHTRLAMSKALATQGDVSSSRLELELAAQAFGRMGAVRDRDEAASLLNRERDPFAPLTPRQREVARLVAAGRTNREIASALVVSERTAEYHVQQILNRLGLDSRAQIAAWYGVRR